MYIVLRPKRLQALQAVTGELISYQLLVTTFLDLSKGIFSNNYLPGITGELHKSVFTSHHAHGV